MIYFQYIQELMGKNIRFNNQQKEFHPQELPMHAL